MPLSLDANRKPNVIPGGKNGMNTVIVRNAISYLPTLVNAAGKVNALPPNGNLTITENEQHVNSGWLAPKVGEHISWPFKHLYCNIPSPAWAKLDMGKAHARSQKKIAAQSYWVMTIWPEVLTRND
jgi:hypothetical protein